MECHGNLEHWGYLGAPRVSIPRVSGLTRVPLVPWIRYLGTLECSLCPEYPRPHTVGWFKNRGTGPGLADKTPLYTMLV